jgi:hypothetical protein
MDDFDTPESDARLKAAWDAINNPIRFSDVMEHMFGGKPLPADKADAMVSKMNRNAAEAVL